MTIAIQTGRAARGRPQMAQIGDELAIVDGVNVNKTYDGRALINHGMAQPRILQLEENPGSNYINDTTFVLNASALFADDRLIGAMLSVAGGGNKESRLITDNTVEGASGKPEVTLLTEFDNAYTAATSIYKIHQRYTLTASSSSDAVTEAGEHCYLVTALDKNRPIPRESAAPEITPETSWFPANKYSDLEFYKVTTVADQCVVIDDLFKPTNDNATHWRVYGTKAGATTYYHIGDYRLGQDGATAGDGTWTSSDNIIIDVSDDWLDDQDEWHMEHHCVPTCTVCVSTKNRLFMGGTEVITSPGTVTVADASRNVTGTSTAFTTAMEGMQLRFWNDSTLYEIRTVLDATHLILYERAIRAYTARDYAILGWPRTLWHTEIDQYSAQPRSEGTDLYGRALEMPSAHGESIVGAASVPGDDVLIFTENSTGRIQGDYDLTVDKLYDIGASSKMGIVSMDVITAFPHTAHGIYASFGGNRPILLSTAIPKQMSDDQINRAQNANVPGLFFTDEGGTSYALWFYAEVDETALSRGYLLNRTTGAWQVYQGPCVTALGLLTDSDGLQQPVVGDAFGRLWWLLNGTQCGAQTTTKRGIATSATSTTLTDTNASFTATGSGELGVPVWIIAGTGSGQWRWVYSNTATALTVHKAWTTTPDTTSVYQLGAMRGRLLYPPWHFGAGPDSRKTFSHLAITVDSATPTYSTGKISLTKGSATVTGVPDGDGTSPTFPTTVRGQPLFADGDHENIGWITARGSTTSLTLASAWTGETGPTTYSLGTKFLILNLYRNLDDPDSDDPWRTLYYPMANDVGNVHVGIEGNYLQLEVICYDETPVGVYNISPQFSTQD